MSLNSVWSIVMMSDPILEVVQMILVRRVLPGLLPEDMTLWFRKPICCSCPVQDPDRISTNFSNNNRLNLIKQPTDSSPQRIPMSTSHGSPFTSEQLAQYPYNQVLPASAFIPREGDLESEFWAYFVQKQPKLGSEPISITIKELGRLNPRNLASITEKLHDLGYHTKVVIDHWITLELANNLVTQQAISALRIAVKPEDVLHMKNAPRPYLNTLNEN